MKRALDVVVPLASVDAFNSIAPFGRAYADDERRPTIAMGMSLDEGVTVDHLHARLGEWRRLVVTAQLFFEEVAARQSSALVRFGPHAFDEQMHAMARLVLARVRTPHVADALLEWLRAEKADSSAGALEAWLEGYAREHPETGRESSARYRSGAAASDVEPWLEMIDGLVVERAEDDGEEVLTVRHTIPHATLRISPRRVRSCAFVTTPGLAMIELELDDGQTVCVGAEDFAFGVRSVALVVEGVSFVTESAARAGSWQLQFELATTMRMVPGMDVAALGGRLAWLHNALAGARAAGIDCAAESERFDRLVGVLRRWLTQPPAGDDRP